MLVVCSCKQQQWQDCAWESRCLASSRNDVIHINPRQQLLCRQMNGSLTEGWVCTICVLLRTRVTSWVCQLNATSGVLKTWTAFWISLETRKASKESAFLNMTSLWVYSWYLVYACQKHFLIKTIVVAMCDVQGPQSWWWSVCTSP